MYASNSTEMDFWSRMLAGFDLPRLDANIFSHLEALQLVFFW